MAKKFNCPSCGAENSFKSAASLFVVCPFCRSSIFRNENEIELLGKVSEIAEDNSPLQLGVQGQFKNQSFNIVGRARLKWKDGFWNEWYLLLNDGTQAWLGEAQGEFMLTKEIKSNDPLIQEKKWFLKDKLKIANQDFIVIDIKEAEVQMAEGELPFFARMGDKRLSADFRPIVGNQFGSLERYECEDKSRVYLGQLVQLSELKLSYLRKFDGW